MNWLTGCTSAASDVGSPLDAPQWRTDTLAQSLAILLVLSVVQRLIGFAAAGVGLPLAGADVNWANGISRLKFLMLARAAFGARLARLVWPVYGALSPPRTFEDAAAPHRGRLHRAELRCR